MDQYNEAFSTEEREIFQIALETWIEVELRVRNDSKEVNNHTPPLPWENLMYNAQALIAHYLSSCAFFLTKGYTYRLGDCLTIALLNDKAWTPFLILAHLWWSNLELLKGLGQSTRNAYCIS